MVLGVLTRRLLPRPLLLLPSTCPSYHGWKDATVAMLVPRLSSATVVTRSASQEAGAWREGASLIITAKNNNTKKNSDEKKKSTDTEFDYKLLVLKKKHDKKGMLEFPGGAVTKADYAIEWAELFRSATKQDFADIVSDFHLSSRNHPPILQRYENGIPAGLATRVAAIRETFELTGILIVKGLNILDEKDHIYEGVREEIKAHPEKFMSLCKLLRVVPDIWALSTWSNWLTPPLPSLNQEGLVNEDKAQYRRYDSVNYVCCLDRLPEAVCDKADHQHAEWLQPSDLWEPEYRDYFLAPLQFDIARLANFPQLAFLHTFLDHRAKLGLQQTMLTFLLCKDGILTLLPGDDLYPEQPNLHGGELLRDPRSISELWHATKNHHRVEMTSGDSDGAYRCNIQLKYGQPVPTRRLRRMLVFP